MRAWSNALSAVAALLLGGSAFAQVPTTVPFQARLTDADGAPIDPGTAVAFSIFDVPTGGSALWGPESHTVTPANGVVSVFLGAGDTPVPVGAAVFSSGDRYLEIRIAGETLSPRLRIGSAAYALRAGTVIPGAIASAEVADNTLTAADLADNSVTSAEIADGTVATADLASNAVTAVKIADGAITGAEIADGTVATADLASNAVTAVKIADGAITGADVADGSLTGADISDEPGVARNYSASDVGLTSTPASLLSRAISAPRAGYVIAIASATYVMYHTNGTADVGYLSVNTTVAENGSNGTACWTPAEAPTSASYESMVSVGVFAVGAGTTTFHAVGTRTNGQVASAEHRLTLLYVPTSYGTVTADAQAATEALDDGER